VRWHDLVALGAPLLSADLDWTFDRQQYEAAIAGALADDPHPWHIDL